MGLLEAAWISENRYEYISSKGNTTAAISNGGGTTNITIPHGLPYIPFVRCYLMFPFSSNIYTLVDSSLVAYPQFFIVDDYHIDSTNIVIQITSPIAYASGGNYTIYYRIYAEPQS